MEELEKSPEQVTNETRGFFQKVYMRMCAGLIISGLTAFKVASNPFLIETIVGNSSVFYGLLIFELLLVFLLGRFMHKISGYMAMFMFMLYSFVTGLTLSIIFLIYTIGSIGQVFFIAAGMFGITSIYGYFTKTDLTSMGQLCIMGLFGIIIASIINFYFQNLQLDYGLSIIGILVFTGLTAYDTQRIKELNIIGNEDSPEDIKESISGALILYLDFINLFLRLLRIFGKRR